jgi:hypothetical protein
MIIKKHQKVEQLQKRSKTSAHTRKEEDLINSLGV